MSRGAGGSGRQGEGEKDWKKGRNFGLNFFLKIAITV